MSNNPTSKLLTFQSLISDCKYEVVLPIIQRDYAQGREGKEELRENFLNSLIGAVITGKTLELDFVYGDVRNGIFKPLDGQQRLTTLFLLHWYAATKNPSNTDKENILSKFTYETRTSSREFCENLVSKGIIYDETKLVSELIVDSSWFFLSWKRDPTIQSMLTMLDAIHEKFKAEDEKLWDRLNNISFHFIELQDFGLSDDLYIKMNARGKPLTDFENFKAKFEQFIEQNKWEDRIDIKDTFAHKIDTVWTDIFWKHKGAGKTIVDDEILIFLGGKAIESQALKGNEKRVQELYNNPQSIRIEDFSKVDEFKDLIDCLDLYVKNNFDELKIEQVPMWNYTNNNSLFLEFIGNKSSEKNKYIGATYPQRIIFYAQTRFLIDYPSFSDTPFFNWMRFVRNIVENTSIDSPTTFVNAIKALESILIFKNDILNHLKDGNCDQIRFFGTQIKEEKIKAHLILNPDIEWKKYIEESENHGLFRGNIGFLFDDGLNSDFEVFKTWQLQSFEFFDDNGIKDLYKKNSVLIRALVSQFDDWSVLWKLNYDSSRDNWKQYVLKDAYVIPFLQKILYTKSIENLYSMIDNDSSFTDVTKKLVHEDLYKSKLLTAIEPGSYLRVSDHIFSLYPYNAKADWKKYVVGIARNKTLAEWLLKGLISLKETKQQLKKDGENLPYFWGWHVHFYHGNEEYIWDYYGNIRNTKDNQKIENFENILI